MDAGQEQAAPGGRLKDMLKRVVKTSAADKIAAMDKAWNEAVAAGQWDKAAQVVNGFSAADMKTRLAALPAANIAKLHAGAIANRKVGQNSAVALATAAIQNPVMGTAQTKRLAVIVKDLPAADQQRFKALIDAAKSPAEKSYIGKGLAAGHSIKTVEAFAAKIAGKDAKWMQDNLSLTGNSEGKGVKQQWSMSCNATAQEAVRGAMDPIYALKMHEENPDLTEADEASGTSRNPKLAKEQKKLLETPEPDGSKGGDAVARGSGIQADGRWNTDLLNNIKGTTGASYEKKVVGTDETMDQSVTSINDGLSKGLPVPIVVGDASNPMAHYVVIMATDPGPPRYYSIHDPASGNTVTRSEDQLRTGNIDLGWTTLYSIEKPTEIPKKPRKVKARVK